MPKAFPIAPGYPGAPIRPARAPDGFPVGRRQGWRVRYIFYGAGAIGGALGAQLFEIERDVVLIARGEHGRKIAADGLRFGTFAGWRTLRIPVVEHRALLTSGPSDVVVLSMKSHDPANALETLAPLAGPNVPI